MFHTTAQVRGGLEEFGYLLLYRFTQRHKLDLVWQKILSKSMFHQNTNKRWLGRLNTEQAKVSPQNTLARNSLAADNKQAKVSPKHKQDVLCRIYRAE